MDVSGCREPVLPRIAGRRFRPTLPGYNGTTRKLAGNFGFFQTRYRGPRWGARPTGSGTLTGVTRSAEGHLGRTYDTSEGRIVARIFVVFTGDLGIDVGVHATDGQLRTAGIEGAQCLSVELEFPITLFHDFSFLGGRLWLPGAVTFLRIVGGRFGRLSPGYNGGT